MNAGKVQRLLEDLGAIITNSHICLTPKTDGWHHSDGYVNKDTVTKHPWKALPLYQMMAEQWLNCGVEIVAGPAQGAIPIAHFVALHLSQLERRDIIAVYLEPEDPTNKASLLNLFRGFNRDVNGKKVLVVDDVFTSGGSALRSVEAVRRAGGNVIGVAGIAYRGRVTVEEVGKISRLTALTDLTGIKMTSWPDSVCPLCNNLVPLRADIGNGRDWLKTPLGRAWLLKGGREA